MERRMKYKLIKRADRSAEKMARTNHADTLSYVKSLGRVSVFDLNQIETNPIFLW